MKIVNPNTSKNKISSLFLVLYGWNSFELEGVYVGLLPYMAIRNYINQITRFYNY